MGRSRRRAADRTRARPLHLATVSVAVACRIQPDTAHVFAVLFRIQQSIHQTFESLFGIVRKKLVELGQKVLAENLGLTQCLHGKNTGWMTIDH